MAPAETATTTEEEIHLEDHFFRDFIFTNALLTAEKQARETDPVPRYESALGEDSTSFPQLQNIFFLVKDKTVEFWWLGMDDNPIYDVLFDWCCFEMLMSLIEWWMNDGES